MQFITKNFQETQKLAKEAVKKLAKTPRQGALVLALQGELGAGKTTFIQGLAKALGVKEKILSPTFVIMRHFKIANSNKLKIRDLYHLDCYRIDNARDLNELGLTEILKGKNNLVAIEWAERIKDILPSGAVWLEFEHRGGDERKIKISN